MILLTSTSDLLRVITGTDKTIDVHASWVDNASGTITPGRTNTLISTATTTTVVASPAASTQRNVQTLTIRNRDTTACDITVIHSDGTNIPELCKTTLAPNTELQYLDGVGFQLLDLSKAIVTAVSVADQVITAATLTLITGSLIAVPVTAWQIGLTFFWRFYTTKTAAGTAASTIFVRAGTAGTTADGIVAQFSTGTATAAVDTGLFEISFTVRTLGASATAMANMTMTHNLDVTGWSNIAAVSVNGTMSAFNTTTATFIHVSITSGTSVAPTVQSCLGRLL